MTGAATGTVPQLAAPATEPVVLAGAEVVQAVFEHAGSRWFDVPPGHAWPRRSRRS